MDRLAIVGILVAFISVIGGYAYEGGAILTLFHLSAFIIVIGGSFGAVMLQTPKKDFLNFKSPTVINHVTVLHGFSLWGF